MTPTEAYEALGLEFGAGQDEVRASYRRLTKEFHPDTLGPSATADERVAANDRMRRLNEAVEVLKNIHSTQEAEEAERAEKERAAHLAEFAAAVGQKDAVGAVTSFLRMEGLTVQFDGSLVCAGMKRGDLSYLNKEDVDHKKLTDDIRLLVKRVGGKVGIGEIQAAIRKIIRVGRVARRKEVFRRLLKPLSSADRAEADRQWAMLGTIYDTDNEALEIAILKKFYYDAKRKALGLKITNHLVPYLYGPQGSGKTTLAGLILSPFVDLAAPPVKIDELIDSRAGDIFDYSAILIDDINEIRVKDVPTLNSIVTLDRRNNRVLGTNTSVNRVQRAVIMITANYPAAEIVPDPTGNRRWAEQVMKFGDVTKGGDPNVWPTIARIDWTLLVRSVDATGPDPISAVREDLIDRQAESRTYSEVELWAADLEPARLKAIETPHGYGSEKLRKAFMDDTGTSLNPTAFGRQMNAASNFRTFPFGKGKATNKGRFYPWRGRKGSAPRARSTFTPRLIAGGGSDPRSAA